VSRAEITKWALICGAAAIVAAAMLPEGDPVGDPETTPLFELLGDNEIPNPVIDDLLGLGADVVTFLTRMVPD
jgi:hypothetical protein